MPMKGAFFHPETEITETGNGTGTAMGWEKKDLIVKILSSGSVGSFTLSGMGT